jgi:hypothetical protein
MHICWFIPFLNKWNVDSNIEVKRLCSTMQPTCKIFNFALTKYDSYMKPTNLTYRMLQASDHYKCDIFVKMDADGMLCLNKIPKLLTHNSYIGYFFPQKMMQNIFENADKYYHTRTKKFVRALHKDIPEKVRSNRISVPSFALGGAYALGNSIVKKIISRPLQDHIDVGLEDFSIGLWISAISNVSIVHVPGSDRCKYDTRNVYYHRCRRFRNLCSQ